MITKYPYLLIFPWNNLLYEIKTYKIWKSLISRYKFALAKYSNKNN